MLIISIVYLISLSVIAFLSINRSKKQNVVIKQLRELLNKKFTDSFDDPQLRKFRVMLPEEIEDIKNTALNEYHDNPNSSHFECHKTLLIVLYSLYSGSLNG